MIVSATISDAQLLTTIALQSKAYWGYSNELIESWREDLTITKGMIESCNVSTFLIDNEIAGFYILNPPKDKTIELEMLFVLPNFIGKGIGKKLLMHSFEAAKRKAVKRMTLLADPNAVPFYTSKGFYEIDRKESSIAGRFLPVMQKDLVR